MNRLASILAIAGAGVLLAGCPKEPSTAAAAATPQPRGTLPPGARAIPPAPFPIRDVQLPEPGNPVVAIRVAFRAGSVDDPKGKEGLTALTAQLMTDGGTKSLSSAELIQALYPMAAELYVQQDKEMTVFVGRVHKDNLEKFLPIFEEVLLEPRMDPKEFERIRSDFMNGLTLGLRTSDDENLGKAALETMLAPDGHPYAHPEIGTESGLKALTLEDAIAQRAAVFGKARMTIGIAGGYDAKVVDELKTKLAALPGGTLTTAVAAPETAKEPAILVVQKPAHSVAISIGFDYDVTRAQPLEWYKMRVVASYFGEHRQMTGDLMQTIREKRGMNYGDYAYAESFVQEGGSRFPVTNIPRHTQHFSMWLRPVQPENAVFALRAALWRYDDLVTKGISKEDFDSTKQYLVGYTRLWDQTTDRRLGWALDDEWYKTPHFLDGFRQALTTMTAEDVNAAIKAHLAGHALQIAMVSGDAKSLVDTIESGKATPAVYTSPKPPEILAQDKQFIDSRKIGVAPDHVKVVPTDEMFK